MLNNIFSVGLDLLAIAVPISLAVTNLIFFPLLGVWLLGARWSFHQWRPVWGLPETLFLGYLAISLVSAVLGVDVRHSLHEIYKKDFYIVIAIVVVALARDPQKNAKLLRLFMIAAFLTAVWGVI